MPKGNEPFQLVATAEQITKQTQEVMENYFGWLQKTISALPWSNTNLNTILMNHATQNVTATFAFLQKLSQARNFQDVIKIQTRVYGDANEFVQRAGEDHRRDIY